MRKKYKLTSDCFIVPLEKDNDGYIAYFPLETLIFEINKSGAELLQLLKKQNNLIANKENIEFLNQLELLGVVNGKQKAEPFYKTTEKPQPEGVLLMTSDRCNLNCLYCYRAAEKIGDNMPIEIAYSAIDEVFENVVKNNKAVASVGYHGGGEPTMNWDVLVQSLNYAKQKAKENNKKLTTTICTNGVMSKTKALWLSQNIANISVSIDGNAEIHNLQRPLINGSGSFNFVAKTLDLLDKNQKIYSIRLTATKHTENKLSEMVVFLTERFNPKTICIEPLFSCGRCETSGCEAPEQNLFIEEMKRVYKIGSERGVGIFYSGNRITALTNRFCGAIGSNFFITPRGEVTSCLEVSQESDPRSAIFIYGKYNSVSKKFDYNLDRYKKLSTFQVNNLKGCEDCIAKWHCGGECISKVPNHNDIAGKRNLYRCNINKQLITFLLHKVMNKQIELTQLKIFS